ncbi:MAG: DUF4176 domain-containing protein [Lachnospiraceae bacterium]|nr:DUF4176 domain-containing protein [Lachnospiraceae bacterium]
MQDLLPIGSVVLLKNGEKKLMITGIMQNEIIFRGYEDAERTEFLKNLSDIYEK